MPKKDYITLDDSIARTVPKLVNITQASSPPRGHKVSGQKLSAHIDKSSKTCHIIEVGWFDTQNFFFFTGDFMLKNMNNYFTLEEWDLIEKALETLVFELEESADPEFAQALENVVLAYDLDQCQKEELVRQYDWLDF